MYTLLFLAFTSFVAAFILTPLCRDLAVRWGFVDRPDHQRKTHPNPVPRMGGVPLALAYIGAFAALWLSPLRGTGLITAGLPFAIRLFPAAAVIFVVGLLDDIRGLRPWQKLLGQMLAGCLAYFYAGLHLSVLGRTPAIWLDLPMTLIWLAACANAFNLIDGVDGLASGVGLFATATTMIAAMMGGNIRLVCVTMPLAGALLGFLRYNFNPATIFLGDSGSLLIGFLLGCFGMIWSQKSTTVLGLTAPLMALAIPLLEVSLSVIRRLLRRQPIFAADRGHIHHRLLDRGFTPRRVALLLYGVCGVAAAFSLLQNFVHGQMAAAVIVLFCAAAWIGIQHLGYAEFSLARNIITSGAFRHAISAQLSLLRLEEDLRSAQSVEECWMVIYEACRTFDFIELRMRIHGRQFHDRLRDQNGDLCWTLRIPLGSESYINFTRPHNSAVLPMGVAPFVDLVRRVMTEKYAGASMAPATMTAGK
jgi:UDP-GlcNAc:undecaprenyl-phosphate GlcNAc-1-phosphate transferase